MKQKATAFDISEYLDNEEIIAEYLSVVMEDNDASLLFKAIGHIAKARGMSEIAKSSGLGRESLYKALHESASPRFDTIVKVLNALDIRINFTVDNDRKKKSLASKLTLEKKRVKRVA